MLDTYLNKLTDTLDRIDRSQILEVAKLIKECEGNIFIFGNGGSAATASHFAQDMNKCLGSRFICLNDNIPSLLAYANDWGYDYVFEAQLQNFIKPNDLVIGISCSGNSKNVVNAIKYANTLAQQYNEACGGTGYKTIGVTGYDGGKIINIANHIIHVPSKDMQICEDIHLIITHLILKINGTGSI